MSVVAGMGGGIGLAGVWAQAQPVDCPPMQQKLVPIPEIVTDDVGHLRGTIVLDDQLERVNFRIPLGGGNVPGGAGTGNTCLRQFMRTFHVGGPPPTTGLADPLPGPPLRARLGDNVDLTLL